MSKQIKFGIVICALALVSAVVSVSFFLASRKILLGISQLQKQSVPVVPQKVDIAKGISDATSSARTGFALDDGTMQWYTERKPVETPKFFKKGKENDATLAMMKAWEVGSDSNGNTIILVAFDPNEPGGIQQFLFSKIVSNGGTVVQYQPYGRYSSSKFSDAFPDAISDDVIFGDDSERINSLEYPGYIFFRGAFFRRSDDTVSNVDELFFNPKTDERELALAYTDPVFGTAFLDDLPDETISFRSPYGTEVRYLLTPDFILNDVPQITWNDGWKSQDTFRSVYFLGGGCGGSGATSAVGIDNEISLDELLPAGRTMHGDIIYEYKDKNTAYLKNWYKENIDFFNQTTDFESKYFSKGTTYEDFVGRHIVFFWKDPLGNLTRFVNENYVFGGGCGKPVIYLYPEKTKNVFVRVEPNDGLTFSNPLYGSGWNVVARPDGQLTNTSDGKQYPYLFWEGNAHSSYPSDESGFVIEKANLGGFFDETLAKLGLSAQEVRDFKEFWVSRMLNENKPYYFITFLPKGVIDEMAPLHVVPKPESVVRIFMRYRGLDEKISVKPFEIHTPERKGFTVVEWGGSLK